VESILTPDTQAVLLLFGQLGQRGPNGLKPLGLRQYNALASWLKREELRPGDLLNSDGRSRLSAFQSAELDSSRVTALLDRGAALGLVVERWERSGLWVISRNDDCYPERLKTYLGQSAPPLLYGVGSKELLNRGGLVVVGSRNRSEEDGEFARRIGEHCAKEGIAVISGAAKGIDREAASGALEAGGWTLGVLAEGLARTATSGQYRSDLVSDRLTLLSPFEPESRWLVYAAMERNKLLYGLGDAALVVASSAETGGTWAGATEALHYGRVKVFIKSTGSLAPGNSKLLAMGGIPFPAEPWENIRALLTPPEEKIGQLFSSTAQPLSPGREYAEAAFQEIGAKPGSEEPLAGATVCPNSEAVNAERETPSAVEESFDVYALVIEQILILLKEPRTEKWLADKVRVRRPQIKDWLARGVREGRITKLKKPVGYVIARPPALFTN
jgi:predicted Rossmann fold nucleotide-binding protein DprA/Smf involved in DNA uptake